MEQKFKSETLKLRRCVKNIVEVYNSSNKFTSHNWYQEANNFARKLAIKYDVEVSVACGIIAALSPLKSWQENKLIAEGFLKNGKGKHTKNMLDKALQIKLSDGQPETIATILNGNKITSFFINIYNPRQSNYITIDRHAISIVLGRNIKESEGVGITLRQYNFFVNCYKLAGVKLGVEAIKVQSVSWQNWREAKNKKDNQEVPF